MTARSRLPARRQSETVTIEWNGAPVDVTVGFDPDRDQPLEVFANGPKVGSDLAHLLSDCAVLISIALQRGASPQELQHSLGTLPAIVSGHEGVVIVPASCAGLLVAAVTRAISPRAHVEDPETTLRLLPDGWGMP